jgi:hypothetical protein
MKNLHISNLIEIDKLNYTKKKSFFENITEIKNKDH